MMKHLKRLTLISFILASITMLAILVAIQFPAVQRGIINTVFRYSGNNLGFQAHVESVAINWFKGTLSAQNIRLTPVPLNTPAHISIKALWLDFGIGDFLQGKTTIRSLLVANPRILLEQRSDGTLVLPWNFPETEQVEPEKLDKAKPFNFFNNLRIHIAHIENGHFEVFHRDWDKPPMEIDGLSISLSTQPRLSHLKASARIDTAHWLNPTSGKTISLTKPLDVHLHSENDPIMLIMQSEIEHFPITVNGHFLPFSETFTYELNLQAAGPISTILKAFNVEGIAVPELLITLDANSNDTMIPDLAFALQSPSLTIGPTQLDEIKLIGTLSDKTIHADLTADTGPGNASISMSSTAFPSFDSWNSTLTFQRFPLEIATPWIPDIINLQGFLDGSIHVENSSDQWMDATASGSLAILKSSATLESKPGIYHLRPEGRLELNIANRLLTLSRLELVDTSLQTELNGHWDISDGTWSVNLSLVADNVEPWTTMAGISAGGEVAISGHFTHSEPERDISGTASVQIKNAQYQDHSIPMVDLSIGIADSVVSGAIRQILFDDLALSGTLSGDWNMGQGETRKIDLDIDSLKWRDQLEQSLAISFIQDLHGQNIQLTNGDSSIRAEFNLSNDGVWNGHGELDYFSLSWIAPILPEPLDTLTGVLSCRLDVDAPSLGSTPHLTLQLENLSAKIQTRHFQTIEPAYIAWRDDDLSIDNLSLSAEDGSRLAVNGSWNPDEDSVLRCELLIPNLSYWPIPAGSDTVSGSLSAELSIRNTSGTIIPEGKISATELAFGSMEITELTTLLKPSLTPGGLTLDIDLHDFRVGADDLMPQVSSSGTIFVAPGYQNIEHLNIMADLDQLAISIKNLEYTNDGKISIALSDDILQIKAFRLVGPDTMLEVDGSIALTEDALDSGNITLAFQAALQPLTHLGVDIGAFTGRLSAGIDLIGPVSTPQITGRMTLDDISWDNPDFPGLVERVNGAVVLTDKQIDFDNISCFFGGGRIDLGGFIERNRFELGKTNLTVRARELDLDVMPELHLRAMADTSIEGIWPDVAFTGLVRITEALYTPELDLIDLLADLARPQVTISEDTQEAEALKGFPLDLTVLAQDNIRIENPHLNLSMTAQLQITGTTSVPGILGSVSLKSGLIDLLMHEFEITGGTLNFTQPFEINPSIDITAETRVQNDIVRFKITGFANRPNLLLSSESGKSHAEIMALLLGSDLTSGDGDLTTMALDYAKQAAARAAAQAISTRTDLIIVPFPNKLENENLLVGVGKYFGEKWNVMYYFAEKSEEGDVIEVEYHMNPKTNLSVRQNQDGSISGGFRYRETFN